ncbi:MAG: TSUP family transporter [Hyphomicrobiales bacterium]|nr:TSUP family transporter [Hyphomicrobiales bacterium]
MFLLTLALLCVAAFTAGFIDAIGGGGGLLTVPVLALAGYNPLAALATNKLQSTFGSGTAALAYLRAQNIELRQVWPLPVAAGLGALLGVATLAQLPSGLIMKALPVLLVLVALYFLFSPRISDSDSHARLGLPVLGLTLVPLLGFYDGAFGPGTGAFLMITFVEIAGFGMIKAAAHTKICNLASNVCALLAWIIAGKVVWGVGLMMGLAQFLGARLGARMAVSRGAQLVRPVLIVICLVLAVKIGLQHY